jgi:N-acetyl-gamma-glutamyl-phosphate reductase
MNVGVVGASGYAGGELLRLLGDHPEFDLTYIAAGSSSGEMITSIHPHLIQYSGLKFSETSIDELNKCDLVFFALPHGESAKLIRQMDSRVKIVDLGADFRLRSSESWSQYYGGEHSGTWTYGLPELPGGRQAIANSTRVANPGCYATSIGLGIAPAVANKIVDSSDIVVVAASGTTGAGRSAKINLLGSEVMNNLSSYKFGGIHQHTPEIEENLQSLTGEKVRVSFTPILAPMPRGILSTITAKVPNGLTYAEIRKYYESFYSNEKFVTLLPEGQMPRTSSVLATNATHLQVAFDAHTERLIISSAIDNLGKGAASQALQNANLMCGIEEGTALTITGVSN